MISSRTNNVKRFCNILGISKPNFVDPMSSGYRIHFGEDNWSQEQVESYLVQKGVRPLVSKIRKRGGYGYNSGGWDLIIPYANENEPPIDYMYK